MWYRQNFHLGPTLLNLPHFFTATSLPYNLAVNTAMHAAAVSAGRQVTSMQPSPCGPGSLTGASQGNSQPGYPHRPSGGPNISSSHSSNPSEGHPGQLSRTDHSPDTTTKDLISYPNNPPADCRLPQNQQSFLAYKAGAVPVTRIVNEKPKIGFMPGALDAKLKQEPMLLATGTTAEAVDVKPELFPLARTTSAAPFEQPRQMSGAVTNILPNDIKKEPVTVKEEPKPAVLETFLGMFCILLVLLFLAKQLTRYINFSGKSAV